VPFYRKVSLIGVPFLAIVQIIVRLVVAVISRARAGEEEWPMDKTPDTSLDAHRCAKHLRLTPARAVAVPLLALTLVAAAAQASPNLVTNGGFEQDSLTPPSAFTSFQLGSWSTNTGTVTDWTPSLYQGGPSYTFLFSTGTATATGSGGNISLGDGSAIGHSPNGGNFIASDPVYQSGSLSQTISGLTVNAPTTVSFYWGVAQQTTFVGSVSGGWDVTLGGATQDTISVGIPQQGFSGWLTSTMTFVPTSASELLTFVAVGSGAPVFLLLDGVSASKVPEPASWAITLAGLVGLGVLSRRRRRSVARQAAA
jgi:hypothetical protein